MKNLKLSDAAVDAEGDALAPLFNNGYLRIYSGSQPASADTAASGTLLAELRFPATGIATSVNGTLTANPIADVQALASGTAAWFRILKSDGTSAVCDGSIGSGSSNYDLVMNSVDVSTGAVVSISGFTHYIPKNA